MVISQSFSGVFIQVPESSSESFLADRCSFVASYRISAQRSRKKKHDTVLDREKHEVLKVLCCHTNCRSKSLWDQTTGDYASALTSP